MDTDRQQDIYSDFREQSVSYRRRSDTYYLDNYNYPDYEYQLAGYSVCNCDDCQSVVYAESLCSCGRCYDQYTHDPEDVTYHHNYEDYQNGHLQNSYNNQTGYVGNSHAQVDVIDLTGSDDDDVIRLDKSKTDSESRVEHQTMRNNDSHENKIPSSRKQESFETAAELLGECFKIVVSKGLGYGIIAGSILVKVPQIVKILNAKSAEGISLVSTSLELAAVGASLAYGFNKGFPFSAYGEAGFLVIQTLIIAFLIFLYSGSVTVGMLYSAVYTGILGYLLSGQAPASLLTALQSAVIPNVVIARMIQVATNIKNQSTGQLSVITIFLLFAGSVARIFTSLQETGDNILILTYIVSSTCNGLILFQIFYYGSSSTKPAPQKKKAKRS